jgi:hypothetical protein
MGNLIASGHIVDAILGLVAVEFLAMTIYRHRTGFGIPAGDLIANLLSGVCLLLALRCALAGSSWVSIAVCLAAALLSHLADLRQRWQNLPRR